MLRDWRNDLSGPAAAAQAKRLSLMCFLWTPRNQSWINNTKYKLIPLSLSHCFESGGESKDPQENHSFKLSTRLYIDSANNTVKAKQNRVDGSMLL